jgi:hypothetical protein
LTSEVYFRGPSIHVSKLAAFVALIEVLGFRRGHRNELAVHPLRERTVVNAIDVWLSAG